MTTPLDSAAQSVNNWTELSGFKALRASAQSDAKATLPVVARQFESIFTQMMLKSMRAASAGDPLFDSQAGDAWRDMADQQLALNLSKSGNGLGIAAMLERQLGGHAAAAASPASGELADASNTGAVNPAGVASLLEDWRQRLVSVGDRARSAGRAALSWLPEDAQTFVRELAPHAALAAQELGLSLRTVLAQAALETQWGKRMPCHADGTSSFNLFGIKAGDSWHGARVNVPTVEYESGVAVRRQAQFRAYESPAQSFSDFARLIGDSPRYAQARDRGDDVVGYARALVEGGYATDPAYAAKVAAIADSPMMRQALAALKKTAELPNP